MVPDVNSQYLLAGFSDDYHDNNLSEGSNPYICDTSIFCTANHEMLGKDHMPRVTDHGYWFFRERRLEMWAILVE